MHAYQKGPIIGEGTYGSVICATQKASGRQVAIKKVRLSSNGKDGVNMSVLRELHALRSLAAPCVVELLDTFSTKSSLVLVFEFMEWSLEDVIRDNNQQLSEADVKSYLQMVLQALAHVHQHEAIHRDIKPDNLLISSDGQLKLADFGLARFISSPVDPDEAPGKLTPQVFGRWYRPPELLMGSSSYSYAVDIWAAGCVFAELLLRKPWFPGNCDMDQLDRIFKVLGVPTLETWPGYADLPHRIDFKPAPGQPLQQVFKQASAGALDLLKRLMAFNPDERISATEALAHPYFRSQPAPTLPAQLPKPASTRLNRLGLSRVPAVIPDMLMPHRLLQQQQQGFATSGIAAAGWADAGEAGEALLLQQQQQHQDAAAAGRSGLGLGAAGGQQGQLGASGTSRMLAFSDAPSFSGRFLLGQGMLPAEQQHQQQQAAGGQRHSVHFAADVLDAEAEQEVPWKGRLSFSGTLDEPTPPPSSGATPAAAEGAAGTAFDAADENVIPQGQPTAAMSQQQQQPCWRPSPVSSAGQKQKGSTAGGQQQQPPCSSSLRPPLHPNATPVHLRTGQQGQAAAAGAADHRSGGSKQRRGVSDLSAALASAASGNGGAPGMHNTLGPLLGTMPRITQQPQGQMGLLDGVALHGPAGMGSSLPAHASTPAGSAGPAAVGGTAGAEGDTACPMSLGTSARKRTRTVFEGAAAGNAEQQQSGQDGGDVSMMSSDRRMVRSRRSSMTSGCCSMDTDNFDGHRGQPEGAAGLAHQHTQQQHAQLAAAGMGGPTGHLSADDRSLSVTSVCMQTAMTCMQAQQPPLAQREQQQRELQYAADMPPPHAVQPRAAAAQAAAGASHHVHAARPWPAAVAGEGPDPAAQVRLDRTNSGSTAAVHGSGGSTCPMSLDHRATTAQRQPQQQQQQPGSSGQQQHPASSEAHLQGVEGLNSGDLVTGGRPAEELRSMDPAELAELAKFLRPRLDSAERRYLRCRTMQLGEALLQASQPDDDAEEGPEYHRFPGMDSSPSGCRGLFDTPAKGYTPQTQGHAHQQQQQQQQHWEQQQQQIQQIQQKSQQGQGSVEQGQESTLGAADLGGTGARAGAAEFGLPVAGRVYAADVAGGHEAGQAQQQEQQQLEEDELTGPGATAAMPTLTAA